MERGTRGRRTATRPIRTSISWRSASIDFLDQELKGQSLLGLFLDIVSQPDIAAFL